MVYAVIPPYMEDPFLLRSDNCLAFTIRSNSALVRSFGLQQEFITPHCPQQNGMGETEAK